MQVPAIQLRINVPIMQLYTAIYSSGRTCTLASDLSVIEQLPVDRYFRARGNQLSPEHYHIMPTLCDKVKITPLRVPQYGAYARFATLKHLGARNVVKIPPAFVHAVHLLLGCMLTAPRIKYRYPSVHPTCPATDLPSAPYASITLARRPLHAGVRVTNGSVARGLPGAAVTRLQGKHKHEKLLSRCDSCCSFLDKVLSVRFLLHLPLMLPTRLAIAAAVPLARRLTSPAPQAAAAESSNPQLQQQREASTAACRRLPGAIAVPFGVGLALLRLAHSAAVRLLPSSGGGGGRVLAPAGFSDVRVFPSMVGALICKKR